MLLMARRLRVRLAHEDGDLAARIARSRRPPLAPIQHILIAIAHDAGADIGRVGRSYSRLGHAVAGTDPALEQRRQPLLFLLRRAVARQHFHVAGIGGGAVEDLGCHRHAAHDLAQRCIFQVGQARAPFMVRQEKIPKPSRAGFRLQLFDDGHRLPASSIGDLSVIERFVRIDMLVHESGEPLLQFLNLRGVCKVHSRIVTQCVAGCKGWMEEGATQGSDPPIAARPQIKLVKLRLVFDRATKVPRLLRPLCNSRSR